MHKRILLLGNTGKMGRALEDVFAHDYSVFGKNTADFDACDFVQVQNLVKEVAPDIIINTVAFLGIDPCEIEPAKAFTLNTLYPKLLAELSNKQKCLLVHFSTDAVFNDDKSDFCTEKDVAIPLNIYGFTKYGGDCVIQSIAENYYIFRVPVLFGETIKNTQFVEKMLQMAGQGKKVFKISDDIISSPTYSHDAAKEISKILEGSPDKGLYHLANEGKGSLYELIKEIFDCLDLDVSVQKASYRDFPFLGRKNTYTPISSVKIDSMRPWKAAVKDYCANINNKLYG
ncbi:MAG: NAD(P)-dependent oxidoreductase [Candidatus Scalindua sp.]|jgi:dTDP-4-dehydrorhamnose reductase|nr:NAD(P)-dependent oxidoreductase [Candidatus Scalindua sp.]